jgi:hypothetical protein
MLVVSFLSGVLLVLGLAIIEWSRYRIKTAWVHKEALEIKKELEKTQRDCEELEKDRDAWKKMAESPCLSCAYHQTNIKRLQERLVKGEGMNCPQCGYHMDDDDTDEEITESPEQLATRVAWQVWTAKTTVKAYTPGLFEWWSLKHKAGEDPKLEDVPVDILLPHVREKILTSEEYRRQKIIEKADAVAAQAAVEKKTCNRHDDCVKADNAARAAGRLHGADHCHDDECKDCFGD